MEGNANKSLSNKLMNNNQIYYVHLPITIISIKLMCRNLHIII